MVEAKVAAKASHLVLLTALTADYFTGQTHREVEKTLVTLKDILSRFFKRGNTNPFLTFPCNSESHLSQERKQKLLKSTHDGVCENFGLNAHR